MSKFNYNEAFSRNIGWFTEAEQQLLITKRIAIAGMGGVGGSHLTTLARLGFGGFNIADMDSFELANFNRQACAFVSTIGSSKVNVMADMALDINPELSINRFHSGLQLDNMDEFLSGVDIYVDSLDFSSTDIRWAVFDACAKKGIPAITAAPIGMGVSLLCFMPGGMSFDDYFQWHGQSHEERLIRFLAGLTPRMMQLPYLVKTEVVNVKKAKLPSTIIGCQLCSDLLSAHALKIALNRGPIMTAPRALHFDAYRNKMSVTWRPGGNKNPLQKLLIKSLREKFNPSTTH